MLDNPLHVVFIHGWSCRASDWYATREYLADNTSIKTYALSLPGHPEFSGTESATTIIELADWVVQQITPVQGRIVLCGHSMGGCVALEAATRLTGQNQLQSIILVDTFGLPYGDMDQNTIDSIENPFIENFVSAVEYLVDNTTAAVIDPGMRDWIKARMSSADPTLMLPIWHDLLRWNPDAAFKQINCPIYALNGEHIAETAKARCAPYVQTRVLESCHHFPQFERPDYFFHQLSQLLTN